MNVPVKIDKVSMAKEWNKEYREEVMELANLLDHPICGAKNKDGTICQLRPISKEMLKKMGKKGKPSGRCGIHGGYININSLSIMERLNSAITDKYRDKKISFKADPYLHLFKKCENCPVADCCPEAKEGICQFEMDILDNMVKTVYSNYEMNSNIDKIQLMELVFSYIRKFRVEYYSTFINDVENYIKAATIISKLSSEIVKIMKEMGFTASRINKKDKQKNMMDLAVLLSREDNVKEVNIVDDGEKSGVRVIKSDSTT